MRFFRSSRFLILPILLLGLVAIWILNWRTLSRSAIEQTMGMSLFLCALFVPGLIAAFLLANCGMPGGKLPGRAFIALEKITRIADGICFPGIVAAIALPAIQPQWAPAIQALFVLIPILIIVCIARALLVVYAKPWMDIIAVFERSRKDIKYARRGLK